MQEDKQMPEERFKTTLMGGFDKDDVLAQVKEMREEAYVEKSRLIKENKSKDRVIEDLHIQLGRAELDKQEALDALREEKEKEIEDLRERLISKDEQKERLEKEINEKYQKYIDRYDLIGSLVLEAQEKADQIIQDAEEKRDAIMRQAEIETQKCLDVVKIEVDEKLAEGKRKYVAVQEEMNEIVELINQIQKRFMSSYREVHEIVSTMPTSMRELEDEPDSGIKAAWPHQQDMLQELQEEVEEESFDEADEEETSQNELLKLLEEKEDEED